MTVSTSYSTLSFNGNGSTTAFSVTWQFLSGSLVVTLIDDDDVETVKTISTHYTVSGGTDSDGLPATGTVTMVTAPASGETLRIERVTPKTQATTYTNGDAFPAKTHEAALDKATLVAQENAYAASLVDFPDFAGNAGLVPVVNDDEDGWDFASLAGVDFDIGTVTTGVPGSSASANITGGPTSYVLDLTIPRGNPGSSGAGTGDMVAAQNLNDVADKPTARTNLGLGTGDSPQFTGVQIGHASDTTLTRASAGVAAIEGSNVLVASGIGVLVQAYHAILAAFAGLTIAANKLPYGNGSNTFALADFTAAGRALIDDADAAAQRATLGLGTSAVLDVGTTASKVVQLTADAKLPAVDGSLLTNLSSAGKLVSRNYTSYATNTNLSTVIPYDDTVPQSSEGTQILSATITPTSTSNRVRVRGTVMVSGAATGAQQYGIVALFKDSDASALWTAAARINVANSFGSGSTPVASYTEELVTIPFEFEHAPSSTSTLTYKVRIGASSGTLRANGLASARLFGGVAAATMIIEEIAP